ncbi:mannose-6-phosphate isomerase [Sphingopyxis sp. PAMC25046]|uniref:class I mannose-6-phosphate isomerase n=1 Tax=Sphingopyxis sp. PAMC25046 TaxID=2565556 RepID=UPI00109DE2D3|nr:class I mannose-6-phosphate isomerase [Sphingopyxis sp. PAMC25046]QCB55736.1 mannose-6-phosphate isomerase [Sphingopyxis sp. PAMC25046]
MEKPWGVERLPPPFSSGESQRVGEIWFDPPDDCPLLAKYLFTSERLSIQVHPDDAQARRRGLPNGKEECWLVLDAEPGARLGIGTIRSLDREALRAAAISGEIETLMQWHPAEAGMFFHIPPGTVHAIGGGLTLAEIQQKSDVTYRLYDYGRPRDLHLDDGVEVARAEPMAASSRQLVAARASTGLLSGSRLSLAHVAGADMTPLPSAHPLLLLPIAGELKAGGVKASPGECVWRARSDEIESDVAARFLAAWTEG